MSEHGDQIRNYLAGKPRGVPKAQIQRELGLAWGDLTNVLDELKASGEIQEAGGRWRLVDELGVRTVSSDSARGGPVQTAPTGCDIIRRICLFHHDIQLELASSKLELQPDDDKLDMELRFPVNWYDLSSTGKTSIGRDHLHERGAHLLGSRVMFCGPLELVERKRRGEKKLVWLPVFLLYAKTRSLQDSIEFERDGPVLVNSSWLNWYSSKEKRRDDLLIQLGLLHDCGGGEMQVVQQTNLQTCWERLPAVLAPDPLVGPWHERDRSLRDPGQGGRLRGLRRPGFYSRILIIKENLPNWSKGLIEDLREIGNNATDADIRNSALAASVPDDIDGVYLQPDDMDLKVQLQESSLSPSQASAVDRALQDRLSVVEGPPGTGKSTVVRSALLSVGAHGGTVLFASYNHKAVDAVTVNLNKAFADEDTCLIADLRRKDGQVPEWTDLLRRNLHGPALDGNNEVSDFLDRIAHLEQERDSLLGWILAIEEEADQLAEANERIHDRDCREIGRWREFGKGLTLSLTPDRARELLDARRLPWWHLRRWLAFPGWRRLLRLIRSENPAERDLSVEDAIAVLEWKLLYDELSAVEASVKSHGNVHDLSDQLLGVEQSRLDETRGFVMKLPALWAQRVSGESQWISRIAGETDRRRKDELLRDHFMDVLPGLPLWAISNKSVKSTIPRIAASFDLAVIDEAAQCDLSSVLPILFRAKRAMLVGDENQLSPLDANKISRESEERLRAQYGLGGTEFSRFGFFDRSAYSMASDALALYEGQAPGMLIDHFRCHPAIADFFSKHFYGGKLVVRTTADSEGGIRWTHVPGGDQQQGPQGQSRWDPKQVRAVVEELQSLKERRYDGTVGVVTPFTYHAKRIRDAAEQALGSGILDDWDFICDSVDKFQGGEKDLILVALVGGGEGGGSTPSFYKTKSTLRRFNVAFSRAKLLLHVFGDRDWARRCGVAVLEHLVVASEAVSNVDTEFREDLVGPVWEPRLADELRRVGINFRQQYRACGFYLDFAVLIDDPEGSNGRRINIEVDGETYHRDQDGNLRKKDVRRDLTLRLDGWEVRRFWVYELRDDMSGCIRAIQELVQS